MTKIFALLLFAFINNCYAQEFYFYSGSRSTVFDADIASCIASPIYTCTPTNNLSQWGEDTYFDIAMDNSENMYYVTAGGSLYRRNMNDENSCEFLGSFNDMISSLTADPENVYAAVFNQLHRYNIVSGTFSVLGDLGNMNAAGDMFFYEGKLFLTVYENYQDDTLYHLLEVNLSDPAESSIFMTLPMPVMAAFSISFEGHSKAYYLMNNGLLAVKLYEIDMEDHVALETGCQFNFNSNTYNINGAAAYYDPSELDHNDPTSVKPYILTNNPVLETINIISTNFEKSKIIQTTLYDIVGQKAKTFNDKDTMNVTGISPGCYFLEIICTDGIRLINKIIIK
ncbi:T9SS type A sorting domain-containing protein [Flavobacterium sp.]|uniref:T9SS type A sorting domain-containing protein n=2 Tax=Flavobacterium sp. TaxID=239 RepID=UPI0040331A50